MAKARSLPRDRLSRRGVDGPARLATLRADIAAIPSVPSSLVAATASAAVRFAGLSAGLTWLGGSPSSTTWPAARLAIGVYATMTTTPWKALGIALARAGLTAAALAAGSAEAPAGPQEPPEAGKAPAKDVESRLADVERKLDRLTSLLEALAARPSPAAEAPAPPSSTPPATQARTLREIEAQLVNLERKYRIVDELVRSARAPAIDREDVIAPARVLVARLREVEDKARAELAPYESALGLEPGALDDPVKAAALVESRLKEAGERLKRADEASGKAVGDEPNGPAAEEARAERGRYAYEYQTASIFLGLPGATGPRPVRKASGPAGLSGVGPAIRPTYSRLAQARRLIAWAKEHFPDVELTADDPVIGPPAPAEPAEE